MRDEPARPITEEETRTLLRDGAVLIKGVLSDE